MAKYKIYCEDEQEFKIIDGLIIKEECPTSSGHSVRAGSLSILQDHDNWTNCEDDYIKSRHNLIEYVTDNWQTMSSDELKQASEHFCTDSGTRDLFFTLEEQIDNGQLFHKRSCRCRSHREDLAVSELFNRLTYSQTGEIIKDVGDYLWQYSNMGVEGTTEGDEEGIFDYFTSTLGTSFENNGFLEKGFTPRGVTASGLATNVLNILKHGKKDI